MPQQNPRARHLRQLPDAVGGSAPAPSREAQNRLTDALRDRAASYRADAAVDLTLVDVLVRMDQVEAAARTLDEHRASLQAMAHDLAVAVADAAVEREAENVWSASLRRQQSRWTRVDGVRRRLVALTGAAAVVVALLLPSTRISPRTIPASFDNRVTQDEIVQARTRLEAARAAAVAVRAGTTAPNAGNGAAVRQQLRAMPAADAPGESAASPSRTDPVTVLAEARAARQRTSPPDRPSGGDREAPAAPVIPLRTHDVAPLADPAAPETGLTTD